jgi:prepilin-type N-terminal cleavage/methylation domain-containing protein
VNQIIRARSRQASRRRGVTLVEMLVTVAMLVIIMTILVQVFQAATGALSSVQKLQQIDDQLRRLDSVIRSDLEGVTARFTPPLDPAQNLGYFEYGENEFADVQGEDSDDYIRFTTKAPEGRPFTGRMWVGSPLGGNFTNNTQQPVMITSEYAEIIYFLRNGNLYRRVLLVAPQLQPTIVQAFNNTVVNGATTANFTPQGGLNGNNASWQGMNELSAHPAASGNSTVNGGQTIILNTLGMLTNRENRAFSPRFANDYWDMTNISAANPNGAAGQDGIPDDLNSDNVPDSYPSLYFGVFSATNPNVTGTWQLTFEPAYPAGVARQGASFPAMAFPYVFPGAYTVPQAMSTAANTAKYGWIHAPAPFATVITDPLNCTATSFDNNPVVSLPYLQSINHNPLDFGDNLPTLDNAGNINGGQTGAALRQTWWGFPTWRETLAVNWNDPTVQVNVPVTGTAPAQPNGLTPRTTSEIPMITGLAQLLPAMTSAFRLVPQSHTDGLGNTSVFATGTDANLWAVSWEDDLILTGVRSFDVKAYDNSLAAFADLGWGDDLRITTGVLPTAAAGTFLYGNQDFSGNNQFPPLVSVINTGYDYINNTFMHEGRMPPLVEDQRVDAQFGLATYPAPAGNTYTGNIGDDSQGIVRLRRVWDSWSTEYTQAPASGVSSSAAGAGFPVGPPYTPPIYPSYPPPYPAPLRGIQIQIRAVDPTNQKIKSLTIRADFSDKL